MAAQVGIVLQVPGVDVVAREGVRGGGGGGTGGGGGPGAVHDTQTSRGWDPVGGGGDGRHGVGTVEEGRWRNRVTEGFRGYRRETRKKLKRSLKVNMSQSVELLVSKEVKKKRKKVQMIR